MQLNQEQERRFDNRPVAAPERDGRTVGDLLRELSNESSTLLRQEVALAKAEMSETAARLGNHAMIVGIGGGLALAGGLAILFAVIYGLHSLLTALGVSLAVAWWVAPTIVGVVLGVIGYLMIRRGVDALKRETIAPRKTAKSLEETKEWMKDKLT